MNQPAAIRPWRRSPWPWILLAVVGILIGGRLSIDPLASHLTRRGFAKLKGYRVEFRAVHVSLLRPAYRIDGLKISRIDAANVPPLLYVDRLTARPLVENLLQRDVKGVAIIEGLVAQGSIHPQAAEQTAARVHRLLPRLESVLRRCIPLRIHRVELHDAELRLVDVSEASRPELRLSALDATLDNFGSGRSPRGPTVFAAHMRVQSSGELSIFVVAHERNGTPTFAGQVELRELELAEVSSLFAPTPPRVTGKLDLFLSLQATHGVITGEVRPVLQNVRFEGHPEAVGALQAGLADSRVELLPESEFPADTMLPFIPVRGHLSNAPSELLTTVSGVFRSVFAKGLAAGLANPQGEPVLKLKPAKKAVRKGRTPLSK